MPPPLAVLWIVEEFSYMEYSILLYAHLCDKNYLTSMYIPNFLVIRLQNSMP